MVLRLVKHLDRNGWLNTNVVKDSRVFSLCRGKGQEVLMRKTRKKGMDLDYLISVGY